MFSKEPTQALTVLEQWRDETLNKRDDTPIFIAIKDTQTVFNGYGAQETCDMLFEALLSPCMPAYLVCRNVDLWNRLLDAVRGYQQGRLDLVSGKTLPAISTATLFNFKTSAHSDFLTKVYCYRKKNVLVSAGVLEKIHRLGLLDPEATIMDDGTAVGKI